MSSQAPAGSFCGGSDRLPSARGSSRPTNGACSGPPRLSGGRVRPARVRPARIRMSGAVARLRRIASFPEPSGPA